MTVDLIIPRGWHELSQSRIMWIFRMLVEGYSTQELKIFALLKFSNCKVIGRVTPRPSSHARKWLIRQGKRFFSISTMQITQAAAALDWLENIPPVPTAVLNWKGFSPVNSLFHGVSFDKFLITENLYQGYLEKQDDSFLEKIAGVLYEKPKLFRRFLNFFDINARKSSASYKAFLISIFYWVTSLKMYLSRQFSDFFQPLNNQPDNLLGSSNDIGKQLIDSMNAQIRALTKGDITKEEEILKLDTWRALTELNAQAREYAEINAKIKK